MSFWILLGRLKLFFKGLRIARKGFNDGLLMHSSVVFAVSAAMTIAKLRTEDLKVKALTIKLNTLRPFAIAALKWLLGKFGGSRLFFFHLR